MCFGGGGQQAAPYVPPQETVGSPAEVARMQRLHAMLGADQQRNAQTLDQYAQDATKITEPTRQRVNVGA